MCSNVCEQTKFYDSDFCHILELHYGYFDIWYFYWTAAPTAMQFRVILIASNVGSILIRERAQAHPQIEFQRDTDILLPICNLFLDLLLSILKNKGIIIWSFNLCFFPLLMVVLKTRVGIVLKQNLLGHYLIFPSIKYFIILGRCKIIINLNQNFAINLWWTDPI